MSFCWLLVYSWFIQCYVVSIFQVSIGGGSGTAAVAAVVTARAKLVCFAPQSRQNDALLYSANSMERRREGGSSSSSSSSRQKYNNQTGKNSSKAQEKGSQKRRKRRRRKTKEDRDGNHSENVTGTEMSF